MRRQKLYLRLNKMLLVFLLTINANVFVNAQGHVFKQNKSGVVAIDAAYYDSTRVGAYANEAITIDNTVSGALNEYYLVMPTGGYDYGGSSTTMDNGTYDAATDAPAAFYTVNFDSTGTYAVYAHENIASGSFWVMYDGNHARFENWNDAGSWAYHANLTSKADKLLTINSNGQDLVFSLVQRKQTNKIDKFYLVESSVSFDPEAYEASTDLYDLQVDNASVNGFDAGTYTYDVKLPSGTTSVSVAGIPVNDSATLVIKDNSVVTADGTIDVSSGSATATIEVTSDDESATITYTINLAVSEATLSSLQIDATSLNGFDATLFSYDSVLPYGTTTVAISAVASKASSTITVTNQDGTSLGSGTGSVNISGISANDTLSIAVDYSGDINTYTVNMSVYVRSTDATLSDLSVDGTTVSGFGNDVLSYDILLNEGVTSIAVGAITTDDSATVAGLGTIDVSGGSGSTDVVVTAEDKTTTVTYTINYEILTAGSTVFSQTDDELGIVNINVEDYTAIKTGEQYEVWSLQDTASGFYGSTYMVAPTAKTYSDASGPSLEYTVNFTQTGDYDVWAHVYFLDGSHKSFYYGLDTIAGDYAYVCPQAWTEYNDWYWLHNRSDKSSVYPIHVDAVGEQTFTIWQRDSSIMIDKIILVQSDGSYSFDYDAYMANPNLVGITIDGDDVAGFDSTVTSYDIELPTGTTSINLVASAYNIYAGLAGTGTIDVSSGSASATIDVTSEDGTATNSYTVNFSVIAAGADARLADILIDGTSIEGFGAGVLAYDVEVPYGTTSVVLTAVAADTNANIAGTGTIDLTSGSASVNLVVTAQNGTSTKTYVVNISVYVRNTDATLASILVDSIALPDFTPDVLSYDVYFNLGTTSINIGATVAQVSATVAGTGNIDVSSGAAIASIVVTAEDTAVHKTYTVNLSAMPDGPGSTYAETAAGIIDFEAEDYTTSFVGEVYDYWTVQSSPTVYYGDTFVQAPAINADKYGAYIDANANAPRLDYAVNMSDTGSFYVWARAYFADGDSDSFFYGLDSITDGNDKVNGWNYLDSLQWVEGTNAIAVHAYGEQSFSIYAREWNTIIDRIILTTDKSFDPDEYIASAALFSISFDGNEVSNFSADTLTYDIKIAEGSTSTTVLPVLYNEHASVEIDGADALNSAGGTITVTVTSEDGTSVLTYTFNYTFGAIGIETTALENVNVYPNPATSFITVTNVQNAEVKIISLQGAVLQSLHANTNDINIDMNGIQPGMYIINVTQQGQTRNLSIIKQ